MLLVLVSLGTFLMLNPVIGQLRSTWPPDVIPDPSCLDYDGSKVPDCREYIDQANNQPVFIEHSFNCSRFWVCEPVNEPCLEECAPCGEGCGSLYFDSHVQYPDGPVCNWPNLIECSTDSTTKTTSTTSKAPSTTSKAPITTSKGPSTTSKVPITTSKAPSTTSKVPSTTSKSTSTTSKDTTTTASSGCESSCGGVDHVCNIPSYDNCNYCDVTDGSCKPGCGDDGNCPGETPVCHDHQCVHNGPGVTKITVTTSDCEGCGQGVKEGGLSVLLIGDYETECQSNGLDNLELRDYAFGNTAVFDGEPELDGDDDGLGHCKDADLNLNLKGGSATWTGAGVWTGSATQTICIHFYDPNHVKPTCCCNLATQALAAGETTDLVDCQCKL